jgi:hypothetical protein
LQNEVRCDAVHLPGGRRQEELRHAFDSKSTVVTLALAGATLATAGSATAQGYNGQRPSRRQVDFGNVAVGYRDGYWDRNHHWNRWRRHHDYRVYRGQQGAIYNDWNHDRNGGDGWIQPAVGIQGGMAAVRASSRSTLVRSLSDIATVIGTTVISGIAGTMTANTGIIAIIRAATITTGITTAITTWAGSANRSGRLT